MATTRLRKTFHYPTDSNSSDSDTPLNLDEEEQETLITTLHTENENRNKLYTRILLILPFLSIPLYIPTLLHPLAGFRSFVLTVLSLTSLGSTGYLLYYIPPTSRAGNGGLRRGREGGDDDDDDVGGGLAIGDGEGGNKGPVTRYLQLLNGGFCVVLGIAALMEVRSFRNSYSGMGGANSNEQGIVLWVVPIVVYGIVMLARKWMADVDVSELESLRYRYKGA